VWVRGQRAGETALEEITALNIFKEKILPKRKKNVKYVQKIGIYTLSKV